MTAAMSPVTLTLRELREEAGLTQAELAELVSVRQATISNLETGVSSRIEFELLDSLCAVLSKRLSRAVEPGELLKRAPRKRAK
jgi:transcriptional regulator with XRE-family HTH domain